MTKIANQKLIDVGSPDLAPMNILTRVCSDCAAHLIAGEKLAEAVGPLLAARRYGGGPGVEQNAAYLAWRLSDEARSALLAGEMERATLCASLALCLVESPQALFIFGHAALPTTPRAAFGVSARMETTTRDAAALRVAAVKLMAGAWSKMTGEAEAEGAVLANRLAHCIASLPSDPELKELSAALAGRLPPPGSDGAGGDDLAIDHRVSQHIAAVARLAAPETELAALGHWAAALALAPDAAALAPHLDYVGEILLNRCFDSVAQGEAADLEAQALLHAYAPHAPSTHRLLNILAAREEWEATLQISRAQLTLTASSAVEWHKAARYADLASHRIAGVSPADAEARANGAAIERLTASLALGPNLDDLRNLRAELRLTANQVTLSIEDYRMIAARAAAGFEMSSALRRAVALNLLVLMPSGRRPETDWAASELARDPPDDPVELRNLMLRFWEVAACREGRAFAAKLAAVQPEYGLYAHLTDFVEDLDRAPAAQFGKAPSGKRLVYGSLVCWGAGYLETLELTALASLAAPGNLPALAAVADIVLEILVGPADLDQILAMPVLRDLAESCEIRVFVLPFPDGDAGFAKRLPYIVYGHGSHFTILRARRDGADLLNLLPDVLYADGSVGALAPLAVAAPRVCFTDGLNIAKTPLMAAVAERRRNGRLSIDASSLAALSAPHWMPRLTDCLYDPGAQSFIHYPHRLVFREADRVVMHSFCKMPFYVPNAVLRQIESFNYETVDGYFLDSILDCITRDQIFELSVADPILLVELSDEDGSRYAKSPGPLRRIISDMFCIFPFSARRCWLFEDGVVYPAGGIGPMVDAGERLRFLNDLHQDLATSPQILELDRERDQIRPEAARAPLLKA